jgi:hypothetical protein
MSNEEKVQKVALFISQSILRDNGLELKDVIGVK